MPTFFSPCILHPTPHTEFPFLVLRVFDFFFPPFLFSHFDSSASHSYHSSVSFSFMLFLFLHSLSTLSKSGSLHGPSMLQFQFLLNLFTVLFILSWSLRFFFKPPFPPPVSFHVISYISAIWYNLSELIHCQNLISDLIVTLLYFRCL